MIYVGTSGFSYKEWKGSFYPEKLPAKEYLSYYAGQFKTTEINASFYRIPSEQMASGWADQVPDDFRFALKLNQKITHRKRLREVDEEMDWFFRASDALGGKLACILVQLPPNFKLDLARLEGFLEKFAARAPLAVEFRHESWFSDDVRSLLAAHKASLAVVEADETPATRWVTAPFIYMRLRKTEYTEDELAGWGEWIQKQTGDVYVYMKHAGRAPELARTLLTAVTSVE